MFKNAFLTEFSLSGDVTDELVLKSHLLSNQKIVIPARTIRTTQLGIQIAENLDVLGNGAISVAHASNYNSLQEYAMKYANEHWEESTLQIYKYFDKTENRSIFDTSDTLENFNKIMQKFSSDTTSKFYPLYKSKVLRKAIAEYEGYFDLNSYFKLIDAHLNGADNTTLKAHAKYFYNYFGSFSTESSNTFSLENTAEFNYITSGYTDDNSTLSGIKILISCALDITDGIEQYDYLESLDDSFLKKLSYDDIVDIRLHWLHREVTETYDVIVQKCVDSYLKMQAGDTEAAIKYIEEAFELRSDILKAVNLGLKSELSAYKIHRFTRHLADNAIPYLEVFSGIEAVRSAASAFKSLSTEVAMLFNKEKKLKELYASKTKKIELAKSRGQDLLDAKSPALRYLELIHKKIG